MARSYDDLLKKFRAEGFERKTLPGDSLIRSRLVFCVPPNDHLLEYWDRVEKQLFKIRNCMNISGVRRNLSLFEPPIDPMLLVRAKAAGLSLEEIMEMIPAPLPPYRCSYLIEKAKQFTQTVQSFGSALLSALEKKDVEELSLLRSVHEHNVLRLTKEIKKQQIAETNYNYQSLIETKTNVQNRINYYNRLIDGDLIGWERAQQIFQHNVTGVEVSRSLMSLLAAITNLIPDSGSPFAMKFGGSQMGSSMGKLMASLDAVANISRNIATSAGLQASFHRRKEEWVQQLSIAEQELKQVEKQELAAQIRKEIAEKDLTLHETNMEQADEIDKFYKNKFTKLGRYDYLATTLNRLYREAYGIAFDLAKTAEQAYKFERDDDAFFIENDNWQHDHAGLLGGERLLLQLQQMEKAYIEKNTRDYEITQSFSLALIKPSALVDLRQTGNCTFRIPEIMFDLYYPGQYRRMIKSVRITIPSVAGPFINVGARLTLTSSKVRKEAVDGLNALNDLPYQVPTASIATSNAQNDSGTFEINFRDEKYLPFEGAGAVDSDWTLELPSVMRSFDYDTISDVIMHISYTSKEDNLFRELVESRIVEKLESFAADEEGLYRLISLKHEFPNEFHKLLHPSSNGTQTAAFKIKQNHFPYFLSDKKIDLLGDTIVYLNSKDRKNVVDTTGLTLKIDNIQPSSPGWEDSGKNMKKANFALSGEPTKMDWIIDAGTNGLNKDELDDILILLRYAATEDDS